MTRRDIEAGRAFVRLYLKDDITKALRRVLGRAGQQMQTAGAAMARMGVVAAAPFALAVRTFVGFDDKMRKVQAVTGATGDDFLRLREKAKELGRTTSFSASQAADGMAFLGQAGFKTHEILESIPTVLALASAGAMDLGRAADIASNVAGGFGLAASDMARVADVLAQAASSSNTNIEAMGEAFKQAAPAARAAGQEIEEAAAAIGILGDSGVDASTAGTDVKNLLTVMARNAQIAGVKTQDASGNMRDMLDVLREVGAATASMTEAERLTFFVDKFGKISAKSAIILANASGRIDELREKMAGAAGRAKEMADTMQAGVGGGFRAVMSAIEGVAIEIGEALNPALKKIAKVIANVTQMLSGWVKNNQALVLGAAAAAAALIAAGGAAFVIGTALIGAKIAIAAVVAVLSTVLSPIGLVTAAVVAGVAAWARYTQSGQAAVGAVKTALGTLAAEAKRVFGAVAQAVMAGDLRAAFEVVKTAGLVAFNTIKDRALWIFTRGIPTAAIGVFAGLKSAFNVVAANWKKALNAFWELFTSLGGTAFDTTTFLAQEFFTIGVKFAQLYWEAWTGFARANIELVKTAFSVVIEGIGKALNFVFDESFARLSFRAAKFASSFAKAMAKAMLGSDEGGVSAGESNVEAANAKISAGVSHILGEGEAKGHLQVLQEFYGGLQKLHAEHAPNIAAILQNAGIEIQMASERFAEKIAPMSDEVRQAFMAEFSAAFDGIEGPVDSATTKALKERLDKLIRDIDHKRQLKTLEAGGPISDPFGLNKSPSGAAAATGGVAEAVKKTGLGGLSGVTFSAAGAIAAGFQSSGGPVERKLDEVKKMIQSHIVVSQAMERHAEKLTGALTYR